MAMDRVEKPWGYELIWAKTDRYVGKILHINAGHRLSRQYHEKKEETVRVLSGEMILTIMSSDPEVSFRDDYRMVAGDTYHIAPGVIHRMSAVTECEVVEVST